MVKNNLSKSAMHNYDIYSKHMMKKNCNNNV